MTALSLHCVDGGKCFKIETTVFTLNKHTFWSPNYVSTPLYVLRKWC